MSLRHSITPTRLRVARAVACIGVCALMVSAGCRRGQANEAPPDGISEGSGAPRPADAGPFAFGGGPWEWETRGIGGGGAFLAAAISPHDANDLSIATDMGMVFRSVDFGRSWFGVHFSALRGGDRSTHRFTSDPNVVYAIDWRGWTGAFPVRSDNGGRAWTRLEADPTNGEAAWIDPDPDGTDRVLIGDWASIHISHDGGATFTEVMRAAVQEQGIYVAGVVWDGQRVLIGNRRQILVSTDGGVTFTATPYEGLPDDEEVASLTGAREGETLRLWMTTRTVETTWQGIRADQVAAFRGVWTRDWDVTPWSRSTTGIARSFQGFTVAASRRDIRFVYVAGGIPRTQMPDVYRSSDGGQTWASTVATRANRNISTGWCGARGEIDFWWGGAPLTFAVSPTDPRFLMFGDYGFVHVSSDGGATWRQAYVDVADQNPAGQNTPRGRAYRGVGLEDTSSWWLHWYDPTTVFAAFSDIRGIASDDGGEHWRSGFSAGLTLNSTYHVVEQPGTRRLFAATSSVHDIYQSTFLTDALIDPGEGHVEMSDDGGRSWTTMTDIGHPVVWLALDPTAPDRMYASVADRTRGGIWVTNDLSAATEAHWRRLPSPTRTEGHPYNVHVLADGTLVTSWSGRRDEAEQFTTGSGIFVSGDGGETWTDRSHADMQRWTKDVVIDPHDPTQNTWYACVFSHWGAHPNEVGGIFRTRDRGETWTRISDLYRVESISIDPRDPNQAYVSTETRGLWHTRNLTDEAPDFTEVLTYPFMHPTRVFFDPHDPTAVWATSFGGGLRVMHRSDE